MNHTQDVAGSLTKIVGRHTLKAGGYFNHSYKAQNTGAGGIANLSFQGYVNFGNSTTNTLDSGFGYSNAALGVFTEYLQASKFIEGDMVYNQVEAFVQDNWKVTNRLTLDYGMRFVHQGPQYDINNTMSNFFPDKWQASQAPVLYVPGCSNGATVCSGNIAERDGSSYRQDRHRGRRGEHAGADRDSHSGHRHCAERDHSGGSGNREHRLHVAKAGGRTSVRRGVRRDR